VAFYCEEEDSHQTLCFLLFARGKQTHARAQAKSWNDDGAVETNCSCIKTSSFLFLIFPH